jgi:hypothetical protein
MRRPKKFEICSAAETPHTFKLSKTTCPPSRGWTGNKLRSAQPIFTNRR